jgi:hypothetical protein
MAREWQVIVPLPNGKGSVSYPASGQRPYTRDEAIEVMRRFSARCPQRGEYGHPLEVYAVGPRERFALADLEPVAEHLERDR